MLYENNLYKSYDNSGNYNSKSIRNSFNITINPNYAWFVKDNLAIGVSLEISLITISNTTIDIFAGNKATNSSDTTLSMSLNPFARLYFGKNVLSKPFIQVNVGYGFISSAHLKDYNSNAYSFGFLGGYGQFISKQVGLYRTIGVSYTHNTLAKFVHFKDINVPISIGLQIHLTKSEKNLEKIFSLVF